jgi:putative transposase
VIAQPRSSQRYEGRKSDRDRALLERMVTLSRENPRYGYRRVWALLRREGWPVNKKRVHRLWRQEGLKVPEMQRKRHRLLLGESENSCTRRQAEHKDHVWSYDFVMDLTEDGRRLKMMPVVDEYTRECLSIDVERSITAEDVVSTLASLFLSRGEPAYIRSDNGPEFIAKAVKQWLEASGVKTLYIEPGSPWENAYSETFISRFSDELLKREVFADLLEAKVLIEDYRGHYNHHRPHSALGYRTPAEFAMAVGLDRKVEDAGKPEELENRYLHSHSTWYRKRGQPTMHHARDATKRPAAHRLEHYSPKCLVLRQR